MGHRQDSVHPHVVGNWFGRSVSLNVRRAVHFSAVLIFRHIILQHIDAAGMRAGAESHEQGRIFADGFVARDFDSRVMEPSTNAIS